MKNSCWMNEFISWWRVIRKLCYDLTVSVTLKKVILFERFFCFKGRQWQRIMMMMTIRSGGRLSGFEGLSHRWSEKEESWIRDPCMPHVFQLFFFFFLLREMCFCLIPSVRDDDDRLSVLTDVVDFTDVSKCCQQSVLPLPVLLTHLSLWPPWSFWNKRWPITWTNCLIPRKRH